VNTAEDAEAHRIEKRQLRQLAAQREMKSCFCAPAAERDIWCMLPEHHTILINDALQERTEISSFSLLGASHVFLNKLLALGKPSFRLQHKVRP